MSGFQKAKLTWPDERQKEGALCRQSKHQNPNQISHRFWNLSHREFKVTANNMLRDLTEKEGSIQGQMDNVGREIEILRKKLKGYIKNEQ